MNIINLVVFRLLKILLNNFSSFLVKGLFQKKFLDVFFLNGKKRESKCFQIFVDCLKCILFL
jgi:hypothetical protein